MFSIVKGIIKFTIESVPIPAGSWQDVNRMLGPVELSVLSKSALNVSLMILLLKVFVRYLTQVFVKNALIDPHAKLQTKWARRRTR